MDNKLGRGDPTYDSLTPDGIKQANATARWLKARAGCCTAVLVAAEERCRQTAAPIVAALGLSGASVDPSLTRRAHHHSAK